MKSAAAAVIAAVASFLYMIGREKRCRTYGRLIRENRRRLLADVVDVASSDAWLAVGVLASNWSRLRTVATQMVDEFAGSVRSVSAGFEGPVMRLDDRRFGLSSVQLAARTRSPPRATRRDFIVDNSGGEEAQDVMERTAIIGARTGEPTTALACGVPAPSCHQKRLGRVFSGSTEAWSDRG